MIDSVPVVSALHGAGRPWHALALRAVALGALVVAGLIGPAAAWAAGTTLHVDQHNPNCSDSGAGTAGQPFCTIGAAATKTAPGTTVLISSGSYVETVKPPVSGTAGNPITYTAAPSANVVVTGSSSSPYAFDVAGTSWITIKGLTLTHTQAASAACPAGTVCGSAAVEVTEVGGNYLANVEITGNQVTGWLNVDYGSQIDIAGNRAD